jgi:hypothetical protein
MNLSNEMFDVAHCLRKEMEYYAKAEAAANPSLKSAYEATAREYAYRAMRLNVTKSA